MRARVSAANLRKLDAVEALLLDVDGGQRGGVLCVPPIEYDLDAWERRAIASQAKLVQETHADIDRNAPRSFDPETLPEPAAAIHGYSKQTGAVAPVMNTPPRAPRALRLPLR